MWAQLIRLQLKPGKDATEVIDRIRAAEQAGSGLVRSTFMHDQSDPSAMYALAVFESEEHARAREQDPRRAEQLADARAVMADVFDGPPGFTDLVVLDEWTGSE